MFANLAHFAYPTNAALVFRVVFGAVEGTLFVRCSAVNWCMAGSTNFEFSELVKLDIDSVVRGPLALGFGLLSLLWELAIHNLFYSA